MGSGNSKKNLRQDSLSSRSDSSVSSEQGSCFLYGQESYSYPPQQICSSDFAYPQPRFDSQPQPPPEPCSKPSKIHEGSWKKPKRSYTNLAEQYTCLEQVVEALACAGLEDCNLVIGIDFTKSNEWTGARSFGRRSLHSIGVHPNPYEQAIAAIGKVLGVFSEDNLIPCYGFGDTSTYDRDVFSFYPDERYCNGFEEVLHRYREIVPHLRLAGPTSFAPIIERAITIVEQSGGQYHVLVIIADGQVTRNIDDFDLSVQEKHTIDAIARASKHALSIILVGVGDGPWDMMKEFCNNIPGQHFSNLQLVIFTEIMSKNIDESRKEIEFALSALMEIPSQYKATLELNLLGRRYNDIHERISLPPPVTVLPATSSTNDEQLCLSSGYTVEQLCPICSNNKKDMAFGCGHQTCYNCGSNLYECPFCHAVIVTKIKLW